MNGSFARAAPAAFNHYRKARVPARALAEEIFLIGRSKAGLSSPEVEGISM
jgi:hypothetical protein